MEYTSELRSRILRDIDDSVLALDGRGRIIYMNEQCQLLLDLNDTVQGRTYAEFQKMKTASLNVDRDMTVYQCEYCKEDKQS